jgi:hypothetical protein
VCDVSVLSTTHEDVGEAKVQEEPTKRKSQLASLIDYNKYKIGVSISGYVLSYCSLQRKYIKVMEKLV